MHVACPERFRVRLQAAIARAVPFERRKPWRSGSMRLDRAVREQQDRLLSGEVTAAVDGQSALIACLTGATEETARTTAFTTDRPARHPVFVPLVLRLPEAQNRACSGRIGAWFDRAATPRKIRTIAQQCRESNLRTSLPRRRNKRQGRHRTLQSGIRRSLGRI